jgi:hypothetical protein
MRREGKDGSPPKPITRRSRTCTTAQIAVEDASWLVNHEGIVDRFDLVTVEVTDELDFGRALTRGIAAAGAMASLWRRRISH